MSPPDPGDPLLGTPPPILGCFALPVGAKRGWRERGDVPARRELSRLAESFTGLPADSPRGRKNNQRVPTYTLPRFPNGGLKSERL